MNADTRVKINMKGSAFDGQTGIVECKASADRPGVWWVLLDSNPSFPMMFLEKELEKQ